MSATYSALPNADTTQRGAASVAEQEFSGGKRVLPVSLGSVANHVAIDFALSNNFKHTSTENTQIDNPTNGGEGHGGQIVVTLGGAHTVTLGTNWHPLTGSQAIPVTLGSIFLISYYQDGPSSILYSVAVKA